MEQEPHSERFDHPLTARRLAGLALADGYIAFDEADQIRMQSIVEVLVFITPRIEAAGDDPHRILKQWEVLDETREYLEKTE